MRNVIKINDNWKFTKEHPEDISGPEKCSGTEWESITLPHTWNALDGQDGGNDFYRGTCWYAKELEVPTLGPDEEAWLEFRGAGMSSTVYMNGRKLSVHEGGYSTFRVNITKELKKHNLLVVSVDNSKNDMIYPQKADFTFYGGINRDVFLLIVPKAHFALGYYGSSGIKVTPTVKPGRRDAAVCLEAWTENAAEGSVVSFSIPQTGKTVKAKIKQNYVCAEMIIEDVHLWDGKDDPYLYCAEAVMEETGDKISTRFGCRSFTFDNEKGFYLNGRSYPLCGVSRHGDRKGVGNALNRAMQREDMALIKEIGANTIRLAHYQHDQYFYDLCDEEGMIVWAEIPYITEHLPNGRDNTVGQMTELVVQNYNHPSVLCWGLSNEITTTGGVTEDLVENQQLLNDLCHKLDSSRPTTMANVFMLETDSEIVGIPDIRSYNLYYGWYVGEVEDNDAWFDTFHREHPEMIIGLSEYGADATLCYQTGHPEKGDYTEQYQALYHEHMLEMWKARPYIWAMHVWNMFDFAADGREDGGEPGVNHKGLVTFDRKVKKDAFYIYKAYLSREPFVHICGRRYIDRTEEVTQIKVYSNQKTVSLYLDGKPVGTKAGDKIFEFHVHITGEHTITAESGALTDMIRIRKAEVPNPSYSMQKTQIVNWFDRDDMQERVGYFSIKDTVAAVNAVPEAAFLLKTFNDKIVESFGDVAKNVKIPESMKKQMEAMSVEESLKQAGKAVTIEMVVRLNRELNKIRKE